MQITGPKVTDWDLSPASPNPLMIISNKLYVTRSEQTYTNNDISECSRTITTLRLVLEMVKQKGQFNNKLNERAKVYLSRDIKQHL